jgi:hypothetical protein
LSMWYKRNEQHYRVALFFSAASLAGAFGGVLAWVSLASVQIHPPIAAKRRVGHRAYAWRWWIQWLALDLHSGKPLPLVGQSRGWMLIRRLVGRVIDDRRRPWRLLLRLQLSRHGRISH